MSIYRLFAENLRVECHRVGSIAEVCRQSGINRQQINKYLAGQMMPTARTLNKLSETLGVPEEALFAANGNVVRRAKLQEIRGVANNMSQSQMATFLDHPSSIFESKLRQMEQWHELHSLLEVEPAGTAMGFESGYYICYFFLQNFSDFLVRSIMKVTNVEGATYFTRHTYFGSPIKAGVKLAKGKHVGFALGNQSEIYLIGKNRLLPANLSMITLERDRPSGSNIYVGLGLTRGITRALASRVCVEYVGKKISCVAGLIGSDSAVSLTDPSLNQSVAFYMSERGVSKPGQLSVLQAEEMLMAATAAQRLSATARPPKRQQ